MAVKSKIYDRHRFRKTYPRFRPAPEPGLMTDGKVVIEAMRVFFDNQDAKEIQLVGRYDQIPSVTVTPIGDINDVNLFITRIALGSVPSNGGRTVLVVIESSAKFTGEVHVQVLQA